jgi:hypothetical protein
LTEDIKPEDPGFCLRQTWRNLGLKYYYACLRWNFVKGNDHAVVEREMQITHQHCNHGAVSDELSLSLFVSFDEDEIFALGEYTSLEGLTDPTTL